MASIDDFSASNGEGMGMGMGLGLASDMEVHVAPLSPTAGKHSQKHPFREFQEALSAEQALNEGFVGASLFQSKHTIFVNVLSVFSHVCTWTRDQRA